MFSARRSTTSGASVIIQMNRVRARLTCCYASLSYIDTADIYGDKEMGENERLIAHVIQGENRRKAFIATKVTPSFARR